MPEPFRPVANTIFRLVLFGGAIAVAAILFIVFLVTRSPYETLQRVPREQPVAFSHEHHSGGLGIDCRYCHVTVEDSSFADIPPTAICMNCHSQMWAAAPDLEPVRESYRGGESIQWTRVYQLPEYVYFDHSIHIHKGIGCSTCHGRVDQMPLTWQEPPLTMGWCLNCHTNPEHYVRPESQVFNIGYQPPADQDSLGKQLVREYHIRKLTSCSICHR
ncbi:MAG TPA: cytochrome c3 family protein [Bryobacteraceae bacterium]|nr:cytochrome c3 family protein [Bryobacteraceae bacterium]